MRIRLYDVTRITRTGLVPHIAIDAEDGAITAVYDTLPAEEPGVRSVDAKGAVNSDATSSTQPRKKTAADGRTFAAAGLAAREILMFVIVRAFGKK